MSYEMINATSENLIAEELSDAELSEVQGGSTGYGYYYPYYSSYVNQTIFQVAEGNWGSVTQVAVQQA